MRRGTEQEIATQESLNTAFGVERVVRYAFEKARSRPRRKLTLVHKTNVLTFAGDLWAVRSTGWAGSSPKWRPTTATWTRPRCSSSPSRSVST